MDKTIRSNKDMPEYTEEDIQQEFNKMKTYQKSEIHKFNIILLKSFFASILFSCITLFLFKNSETGKIFFNLFNFYLSSYIYSFFIALFSLLFSYAKDMGEGNHYLRLKPTKKQAEYNVRCKSITPLLKNATNKEIKEINDYCNMVIK